MKINKYLLVTISLVLLACCSHNNKKLPKRKDGNTCNITFRSNVNGLTCDNPSTVKINNDGKDLKLHLSIPYVADPTADWSKQPTKDEDGILNIPNTAYNVNTGDIAITIGGEQFNESFSYFGETNNKNILTIDKDYIVNDIEINVTARDRGRLFLFGFQFGNGLKDRIDNTKSHTDPNKDIIVEFVSQYQKVEKVIHTLGELAYPVFEDDAIDLKISVEDGSNEPLPNNIWLRTNARYALLDNDFSRKYQDEIKDGDEVIGYRTCHIHVPNYIIRDHGSFVQFDVE